MDNVAQSEPLVQGMQDNKQFDPLEYANSLAKGREDKVQFDPLEYANNLSNDSKINNYVGSKLYTEGEVEPTYVENVTNFMKELNYYRLEAMRGFASGAIETVDKLGVPVNEELKKVFATDTTAGNIGKGTLETLTGQHGASIITGALKGSQMWLLNTGKLVADITGSYDAYNWLDDIQKDLDVVMPTNDIYGKGAELVGQVGAGLFVTKKIPDTKLGRSTQAFLIDFLGFEGETQNIFNLFDEHNVDLGGLTDALKSDSSHSDIVNRLKNGLSAVLPTAGIDYLVSGLTFGNKLLKAQGTDFKDMNPAEVMFEHLNILKSEGDNIKTVLKPKDTPVETTVKETPINTTRSDLATKLDEVTKNIDNETDVAKLKVLKEQQMLLKSDIKSFDNSLKIDTALKPNKVQDNFSYNSAVSKAKSLLDNIDETNVGVKTPLNSTKLAPDNQALFAEATKDITTKMERKTNKEILAEATQQLEKDIGTGNFNFINSMLGTAEKTKDLSLEVSKSQVIVASLFEDYNIARQVYQKEGSASSIVESAFKIKNLLEASQLLKDTGYNTSRSLNVLNNIPKTDNLFNALKIAESVDGGFAKQGILDILEGGKRAEDLTPDELGQLNRFMQDLDNEMLHTRDVVERAKDDTWFTKIGNIWSEAEIGSLLTSPITALINVTGGFYMKHSRLLLDSLQFVAGKVANNSERMQWRTLKNIYHASMVKNFTVDLPATRDLLKAWHNGKYADEAYDEMVHIRYNQDQEFGRKFISAPYIRGEAGEADTLFNGFLNVLGISYRGVHKVIGASDNYYKLGFFRTELAREAGALADRIGVPDEKYIEFTDRFIKANMERHIMRNHKITPTEEWVKANKYFIGGDVDNLRFADQARDYANKMTMQKELEGIVGKGVKVLNSNGYLRTMIPFKTTPINLLYTAIDDSLGGIQQIFLKDIRAGGIKQDKAYARLFMSGSILGTLGYMVASGQITGFFTPEERNVNSSLRIGEYSIKAGDNWVSYQQIEPISTILGVMTGVNRVITEAWSRPHETDFDAIVKEGEQVMKELYVVFAHNILDKAYAKGVSDLVELISPDGKMNRYDYLGNLVGNALPFSGFTNWVNREFGDGYVKESTGTWEKMFKRYEWLLDRDKIDVFGEKVKDVSYMPYTPLKVSPYLLDKPENAGAKELSRLGVEVRQIPKDFTMSLGANMPQVKFELTKDEYNAVRMTASTKFKFKDTLNEVVGTDTYKQATEFEKKAMLKQVVSKVQAGIMDEMYNMPRVIEKIGTESNKIIKEINAPKKTTWRDMILGGK